jgi:hypothetical protein
MNPGGGGNASSLQGLLDKPHLVVFFCALTLEPVEPDGSAQNRHVYAVGDLRQWLPKVAPALKQSLADVEVPTADDFSRVFFFDGDSDESGGGERSGELAVAMASLRRAAAAVSAPPPASPAAGPFRALCSGVVQAQDRGLARLPMKRAPSADGQLAWVRAEYAGAWRARGAGDPASPDRAAEKARALRDEALLAAVADIQAQLRQVVDLQTRASVENDVRNGVLPVDQVPAQADSVQQQQQQQSSQPEAISAANSGGPQRTSARRQQPFSEDGGSSPPGSSSKARGRRI